MSDAAMDAAGATTTCGAWRTSERPHAVRGGHLNDHMRSLAAMDAAGAAQDAKLTKANLPKKVGQHPCHIPASFRRAQ